MWHAVNHHGDSGIALLLRVGARNVSTSVGTMRAGGGVVADSHRRNTVEPIFRERERHDPVVYRQILAAATAPTHCAHHTEY